MRSFYRSRLLFKGLSFRSAIRCINSLAKVNAGKAETDFEIKYVKNKVHRKVIVRGKHIQSDLQTILELAAGDCYRLKDIVWQPDVIIDGGGNTGLFSLAASSKWPNSKVICFEPMPDNFNLVTQHVLINKLSNQVEVIQSAIGDSDRKATFFVREANQGSLDNTLKYSKAIDVKIIRLFEFYEKFKQQKVLIKLDIEGAEFEILRDFFRHTPLNNLAFVMEIHGNPEAQNKLLAEAKSAGLIGGYWEIANETGHLFLASRDVGMIMNGINQPVRELAIA